MKIVRTIAEMRAARPQCTSLGLVPTMGFLHAGHLSLLERARADCGASAASIFVNPLQFGENEDLSRYPRDLPRDLALLEQAGTAIAFVPDIGEIYPPDFACRIDVGRIGEVLEGAIRPGHFSGVATVVAKLFNIVQPTHAYFGQKDAQQSVIIRRLVGDLDFPVQIVVGATVREPDGLAMSSRNVYLTLSERDRAPVVYRALRAAQLAFEAGERRAESLRATVRKVLSQADGMSVDYVSVANLETLEEMDQVPGPALLSVAVRFGQVRLIDNMVLGTPQAAGPHG